MELEGTVFELHETHCLGASGEVLLSTFNPVPIWKKFKPHKKHLEGMVTGHDLAIQMYPKQWHPGLPYTYWACSEVQKKTNHPQLESLHIPAGTYVEFWHTGDMATFHNTMYSIMNDWLPKSRYALDDRPHIQVMDHQYKHMSPDSKERVWIPIKPKK